MLDLSKIASRSLCLAVALLSFAASATPLPAPQDRSILEITGKIANTNSADRARFDLPMLEKMGVSRLKTSTAWTEGQPVFEDVLHRLQHRNEAAVARARAKHPAVRLRLSLY